MAKPAATVGPNGNQGYSERLALDSTVTEETTDDTTGQQDDSEETSDEDAGESEAAPETDEPETDEPEESPEDEEAETDTEEAEEEESEEETETEATEEEEQLLTPEQLKATANDPKKREKLLNRAFTQKSQKYKAAMREAQSALALQQQLNDPIQSAGVIAALAAKHGHNLAPSTKLQAENIVETAKQQLIARGGNKEAIESIMPLVEAVARSIVAPMNQEIVQLRRTAAEQTTLTAIAAFKVKHPDYTKYKVELERTIDMMPMAPNADTAEYLENIYKIVVPPSARVRKGVEKTLRKIEKGARAAKAKPAASVSGNQGRVEKKSRASSIAGFWEEAEAELAANNSRKSKQR